MDKFYSAARLVMVKFYSFPDVGGKSLYSNKTFLLLETGAYAKKKELKLCSVAQKTLKDFAFKRFFFIFLIKLPKVTL